MAKKEKDGKKGGDFYDEPKVIHIISPLPNLDAVIHTGKKPETVTIGGVNFLVLQDDEGTEHYYMIATIQHMMVYSKAKFLKLIESFKETTHSEETKPLIPSSAKIDSGYKKFINVDEEVKNPWKK